MYRVLKIFEDFRAKRIDEPKAFNMKVLEKLKDPKVQKELEPLMQEFAKNRKHQMFSSEMFVTF